jgi:hypothetical protein
VNKAADNFARIADIEEVQRVVIERAKAGNMQAAAIAERAWRRRTRPPLKIRLPPVTDARSIAEAQAKLIAATARGRITPKEALALARLIEHRRRALDLVEFEERLVAIENDRAEQDRLEAADDASDGEYGR